METQKYSAEVLDFFKHAIQNQCKIFVKKHGRTPSELHIGENQAKMLEQDEIAQWMVAKIKVVYTKDKSKLRYY